MPVADWLVRTSDDDREQFPLVDNQIADARSLKSKQPDVAAMHHLLHCKREASSLLESLDSCYSSCSEESHSSISRRASDTISCELAQMNLDYDKHLDFATKLGYNDVQLKIVLNKLGSNAEQDQILCELVKLGEDSLVSSNATSTKLEGSDQISATLKLRSVVIDGSNIAMTHGHKEVFSCRGIQECVNFFQSRGHTDIIVFVPQFRRETARSDCPITDQHILFELEDRSILIWTPSRRIGGRRIVCHDDRYILKTADEKDAIVVSNDEYRDLIKENPQYRRLVEQRLLMYSFVDGKFMPPDDPLGRHGPTLPQFLSYGDQVLTSQLCPYARKCTYGNKCKYYHPERLNGMHVSVTERLMKVKEQRKQCNPGDISQPVKSLYENEAYDHNNVSRTKSLNIQLKEKLPNKLSNKNRKVTPKLCLSTHPEEYSLSSSRAIETSKIQKKFQPQQQFYSPFRRFQTQEIDYASHHANLDRHFSAPTVRSSAPLMLACNQSAPLTPPVIGYNTQRFYFNQPPPASSAFTDSSGNQTSYTIDEKKKMNFLQQNGPAEEVAQYIVGNQCVANATNDDKFLFSNASKTHLFSPSTAVWGESKLSVGPLSRSLLTNRATSYDAEKTRIRLKHLLCELFVESVVTAIMDAHPGEHDPQKLCSLIIELQNGFNV